MAAIEEELTRRWKAYYHMSREPTPKHDAEIIAKLISTNALEEALESVTNASKNRNGYVFLCLVELTAREENVTDIMQGLPNFVSKLVSAYQRLGKPNADAMRIISNISCYDQVYDKIIEAFCNEPNFLPALLQVPQEIAVPAIVLISNMVFDKDFAKHVLQLGFSHRLIEFVQDSNNLKPETQEQIHNCVLQLAKHDEHGVIRGNTDVVDALIKWVRNNSKRVSYALLALYDLASMAYTVLDRFKDDMICRLLYFISNNACDLGGEVAIKLLALYIGKGNKPLMHRTKEKLVKELNLLVQQNSSVGLWAIICLAHLDSIKQKAYIETYALEKLVAALNESNKELENNEPNEFPFDLTMLAIRKIVENNSSARDRLCTLKIASELEASMQLACIKNQPYVFIHAIHALEKIKKVVCMKNLLQTFVQQLIDNNEDVKSISSDFVTAVSAHLPLSFQQVLANAKAASMELVCKTARGGVGDEAKANAASIKLANEATYYWDDEMQHSSYLAQGDAYCPTQDDANELTQGGDNNFMQGDVNVPTQYDDTDSPQSDDYASSLKMSINRSEPMQKRFKPVVTVDSSNSHAMEWLELGLIETGEAEKLVYTVDNWGDDNSSGGGALASDGKIKPIGSADLQMLVQDGMLIQVLTFCGLSPLSIKRMHAHFIPYKFAKMCPQDLHKFLIITEVLTLGEANAILTHNIGLHALCRMDYKDFELANMPVGVQTKLEEWICECRYRKLE